MKTLFNTNYCKTVKRNHYLCVSLKIETIMSNFKEIKVKNIEGEVEVIDFSKQIGNFLYTQGKDVAVCEAGQKIYHGEETDLTDEAKELVRSFAENVPFIFKQAITAEIG